jgi:tetratricopeptide (TPR) repeat protein
MFKNQQWRSTDEFAVAVITLVLGLAFTQARAFADLPDAKTKNLNLVAGRQAIKAKDFKSPVKSLTKAVQENPKDANAHTMLGYSYRKLGTFDKSLDHYQMAFEDRCQSSKRAGISWRALPRHESTCQCRETTPGAESLVPSSANARSTTT